MPAGRQKSLDGTLRSVGKKMPVQNIKKGKLLLVFEKQEQSVVDQPGPPGAPPNQQELEVAYRELLEALWFAHQVFKKNGREGVRVACHAVARFLWVRHENPELAAPFLAFRQALFDFDRGVTPELLSRDPASKERSRSSQKENVRCLA